MDENKNKHTVACYIKKEKDDSKRIKKKIQAALSGFSYVFSIILTVSKKRKMEENA